MTKPSIEEIVRNNVETAVDQRHDYDFQEDPTCEWYEGDAYLQNVTDTLIECGHRGESSWNEGVNLFYKLATEAGLRFAE